MFSKYRKHDPFSRPTSIKLPLIPLLFPSRGLLTNWIYCFDLGTTNSLICLFCSFFLESHSCDPINKSWDPYWMHNSRDIYLYMTLHQPLYAHHLISSWHPSWNPPPLEPLCWYGLDHRHIPLLSLSASYTLKPVYHQPGTLLLFQWTTQSVSTLDNLP